MNKLYYHNEINPLWLNFYFLFSYVVALGMVFYTWYWFKINLNEFNMAIQIGLLISIGVAMLSLIFAILNTVKYTYDIMVLKQDVWKS